MLKVEAQIDGVNFEDLTARVERCRIIHGGSIANPDRPDFRTATGTILLTGQFNPNLQRVRCRVHYDSTLLWSGFIQEPQRRPNRKTRWKISGLYSSQRAQRIGVVTPAISASNALDFAAIRNRFGTITKRNLPSRQLKEFRYEGPLSGLVSRLGLLNSAEIIENKTGNLVAANPHLTAEPQGRTLSATTEFVLEPNSKHIAARIRNTARVTIPPSTTGATSAWTINIDLPEQTNAGPLTATFMLPTDNATYSDLRGTATAEVWLPTVANEYWVRGDTTNNVWVRQNRSTENGWLTVPATLVFGTTTDAGTPVTVTLNIPSTYTQTVIVLAQDFIRVPNPRGNIFFPYRIVNIADGEPVGSSRVAGMQTVTANTPTPSKSRGAVDIMATRTVTTTVAGVSYRVSDAASVALWGERELNLPDWIITNRSRGGEAVQAQIEGLANLRREHKVTLQIASPSSLALDAGDYVLLRVNDLSLNINIAAWCLITGRELRFGDGVLATVTLTCLETALAASQAPGVPQNLTANPVGADIDLRWLAPLTGGVPTRYEVRYRQSGVTAWSSTVSLGLAFTGTITGLTASTPYEFQIRAVNASGPSNWSAIVTATTQAGGNPTPPPMDTLGTAPRVRFRLANRRQYLYSVNNPARQTGFTYVGAEWRVQAPGEAFSAWASVNDFIRLRITTWQTGFILQARHHWQQTNDRSINRYSPIGAVAGPPSSSEDTRGPQYLTLDGDEVLLQGRLLQVENEEDE